MENLQPNQFEDILSSQAKALVMFYADWCPICRNLASSGGRWKANLMSIIRFSQWVCLIFYTVDMHQLTARSNTRILLARRCKTATVDLRRD